MTHVIQPLMYMFCLDFQSITLDGRCVSVHCQVWERRGVISQVNNHKHALISILNTLGCSYISMLRRVCRRHVVCMSLCLSVVSSAPVLLFSFFFPLPSFLFLLFCISSPSLIDLMSHYCAQGHTARACSMLCQENPHTHSVHVYEWCCVCVCVHLGDAPLLQSTIWLKEAGGQTLQGQLTQHRCQATHTSTCKYTERHVHTHMLTHTQTHARTHTVVLFEW